LSAYVCVYLRQNCCFFQKKLAISRRLTQMDADKNINDLTYRINGAIFEVSHTLDAGFLEKVYERAVLLELRERGLKAESQAPIQISYKGQVVGEYFADILVCGKVIIELKCVETLSKLYEAQIINYLKATGLQVGLLVNFKYPKVEIKRIVLGLKE